ncbi:hypothetical protein PROFUN_12114 [Planoprotostelium fungivorum]|uniref:Uncharacterized protein n=1 Tax=Planoprotostelium fungivorum TaxID=1890364 RepID=A0A2P6N8G1_9EUKA|nr:hypothetical protein PROFUN_12114 [Planoprotostelium fungivorum]
MDQLCCRPSEVVPFDSDSRQGDRGYSWKFTFCFILQAGGNQYILPKAS